MWRVAATNRSCIGRRQRKKSIVLGRPTLDVQPRPASGGDTSSYRRILTHDPRLTLSGPAPYRTRAP
jgi:hypothetical protein